MRVPPQWHEDRDAGMDIANRSRSGRVFLPCRTKCERHRQFSWQVKVSWRSSAGTESDIEISPAPEGARLTSASTPSQRGIFVWRFNQTPSDRERCRERGMRSLAQRGSALRGAMDSIHHSQGTPRLQQVQLKIALLCRRRRKQASSARC